MDYSVSINFNGDLVANKYCEITYFGSLFKNNSDSVTIVYGFGNDWQNTDSKEMIKTDNGFVTKIKMLDYESFNFCFRNSNYEWDNNNSQNYTSPITKEEKNTEVENNATTVEPQNVIDVDVNQNDVVEVKVETEINLNNDSVDNDSKIEGADENENNNTENIVAEDPSMASFDASVEKNEPMNIEETLVNSFEEANLNSDIETIFEDIYVTSDNAPTPSENVDNISDAIDQKFNMNSLIDEILSPITSSSVFEDEKNIEPVEEKVEAPTAVEFNNTVQDIEDDSKIDNLIDGLITDLYNNVDGANSENIIEVQEENEDESEIVVEPAIIKKATKVPDFVVLEDDPEDTNTEASLLENIEEPVANVNEAATNEEKSDTTAIAVSNRTLSKFYMIRKKIKLAFMKIFRFLPKRSSSEDTN